MEMMFLVDTNVFLEILITQEKQKACKEFLDDLLPRVNIIGLSKESYKDLPDVKSSLELDFDDAYQYRVASEYNLEIVTMDRDFNRVKHNIGVRFL